MNNTYTVENLRKELNFEVTDKINVTLQNHVLIAKAVENNLNYICDEILASSLLLSDNIANSNKIEIEQTELKLLIIKD